MHHGSYTAVRAKVRSYCCLTPPLLPSLEARGGAASIHHHWMPVAKHRARTWLSPWTPSVAETQDTRASTPQGTACPVWPAVPTPHSRWEAPGEERVSHSLSGPALPPLPRVGRGRRTVPHRSTASMAGHRLRFTLHGQSTGWASGSHPPEDSVPQSKGNLGVEAFPRFISTTGKKFLL